MSQGYQSLSEREKETLRLLVRGYDAKSIARYCELSVHTINERLRNARQKMSVSSSREAARVLLDIEASDPQFFGDMILGEAKPDSRALAGAMADSGNGPGQSFVIVAGGILFMSLILIAFAFSPFVQSPARLASAAQPATQNAQSAVAESDVVQSARQWLALVDAYKWPQSWDAAGLAFKKLNTVEKWTEVANDVQPKFGAVLSRKLKSQESVPAPPDGYEILKFRTQFENKPDAVETLALERENASWKVVGYWIE